MKWHAGTLNDDPASTRILSHAKAGRWFEAGFPADVLREITIFLHTPGLDTSWVAANFGMPWTTTARLRAEIEPFEVVQDEVVANWLSVTREDAIRLVQQRPRKRSTPPLVSQLKMIDDLKQGLSLRQVAADYGVSVDYVHDRARRGPYSGHGRWVLPPEFAMLMLPQSRKWAALEPSH